MGNITSKSGQGTYVYDPATDRLQTVGAHAYSYDDNGNVLSDGERTLTWTAQNMVRSLQRGGQAWSLLYDADGTRVVREETASNSATYNVGPTYELRFDGAELTEARISVLGATGRVVAEVFAERTALQENALWEHHKKFVHDDHLGSAHMISDREGTVEARVMYGPWGAARNGDTWNLSASEADLDALPTGFTGHQPELDAGLINMRGRMYDPAVGRFMSVDPVIENALEVGTWNAYSYVLNRPLSLVDPTGLAAGTQADIERHESFLAEQGFVGADYHDVEAYYANLEFWKPTKWQTHGPRVEEETQKSNEGKAVQESSTRKPEDAGAPEAHGSDQKGEVDQADSNEPNRVFLDPRKAIRAAIEETRKKTVFVKGELEQGTTVYSLDIFLWLPGLTGTGGRSMRITIYSFEDPHEGSPPTPAEKAEGITGKWTPGYTPPGAKKRVHIHSHPDSSEPSGYDRLRVQGSEVEGLVVGKHEGYDYVIYLDGTFEQWHRF